VTRTEYLEQVKAACEFLAGQSDEFRDQLEAEMKRAAAAQEYEKAAALRDTLADLERTVQKTNKFTRIPYTLPISMNPDRDLDELREALALPTVPRRIEGFDISNISGTFAVASMVSFKNGRPDRSNYRRFKMKTVVGQDDFACMAETVRRRYTRLLHDKTSEPGADVETTGAAESGRDQGVESGLEPVSVAPDALESKTEPGRFPDLIVIDGGKGQLNASLAELEKLGLGGLQIIGLAKEFEEIYRPGVAEPLRLSHACGALKLLQRVRDESHRFANTYNAKLRLKKISESILDEFPGIGNQRKAALLKRFGSVQRLRLATIEQIAAVPGFGGKAAAELKAFLEARTVRETVVPDVASPGDSDLPPGASRPI
jgi:excinuclease ABC subunit C